MSGHEDAEDFKRNYGAPYTKNHPIPTIQKYREEKEARQAEAASESLEDGQERSKRTWASYWRGEDDGSSVQKNGQSGKKAEDKDNDEDDGDDYGDDADGSDADEESKEETTQALDTSQTSAAARDPKQRRKSAKKHRDERAEREVTDPVTHLPVTIQDLTSKALEELDENEPPFGTTPRTATGLSNRNKSDQQLDDEVEEMREGRKSMEALFPPPAYDVLRDQINQINRRAITVGFVGFVGIMLISVAFQQGLAHLAPRIFGQHKHIDLMANTGILVAVGFVALAGLWLLIVGVRDWMANSIDAVWDEQVWAASRQSSVRDARAHKTESVAWLNTLVASVWPLVNPDLFTSLADTLEDVMQASLPKLVQMVSVEDIGQGSESLRILGIRWLPSGAAGRTVGDDGKLEKVDQKKNSESDRNVPGEGDVEKSKPEDSQDQKDDGSDKRTDNNAQDGTEKAALAEGMEAEQGDFINLEVAFAYRARGKKSAKQRVRDMHLYVAFWLPGNIKIPVWVDVRGIIGTMRLRLQLAPDPPFFALCTLTFLGQPKVDIGCVPLVKHGLNIMDLPLISNFVQSSIDAAMAEYVAPKSLTLDLKDMLAGDDFKKDTHARGALVVVIKRGYDFKRGDASIPLISEGGSDPYVSVGWAKFGKPMWSTRVLIKEMEPVWNERAFLLVTPEELNVDERLRVQLWDSDRFTADDDLGRIEVDLKSIMKDDASNGKMSDRKDGFRAMKKGEEMPGKLEWSVGYFSKARLQECQFQKQTYDPEVRNMQQLEDKVDDITHRKLREVQIKEGTRQRNVQEIEQQKAQEMKARQDAMIISSPPPNDFPSGIFSVQIHQITGLELESLNKTEVDKKEADNDEEEEGEELPSAYCTVIINHNKAFKTRTKPKNARPFYNASTERFIADWRSAEVFVTVRDARVDEDDPILGIVHLPLRDVFKERAQVNGFYPLVGGVGYGRIRLSMVWRSVQLQAPPEMIGWEVGTLEVQPNVTGSDLPSDLQDLRLKLHTTLGAGKLYPAGEGGKWKRKHGNCSLKIPVKQRYSSCLAIRFRKHGMIKDKSPAFAVLWFRDIPDEEEKEIELPVYTGDWHRAVANSRDDPGEQVGSLKLTVKFWSGLSHSHRKWAMKDPNLRDVVEVLEIARDHYEVRKAAAEAGITEDIGDDKDNDDDNDDSDDDDDDDDTSDDSSDDEEQRTEKSERRQRKEEKAAKLHDKMNLIDQAKDYKKHAKQQHRQNRGIMQYKFPRTAQWAMHKAGRVEDKVAGLFKRHTREPGIETEV